MTGVISPNGCINCRHKFNSNNQMFCKRYPPQVHLVPTPQGITAMTQFVPVSIGMGCGEWSQGLEIPLNVDGGVPAGGGGVAQ